MDKREISPFYLRSRLMMGVYMLLFFLANSAYGQEGGFEKDHERKVMSLPAGAVINKDYFAYGEIVEVSGTVNGDVYAAGGQIIIDGKINGDLIAAGGTINVAGTISQNARIAGGNINISGEIGRNATVAGGNINIAEAARMRGSVVAGAGSMNLAGPISGNAELAAGTIIISNTVAGNVRAASSRLRVTSRAAVTGDLTYWSDQVASIEEGAKIGGKIIAKKSIEFARPSLNKLRAAIAFLGFFAKIVSFVSTLIFGLLFISLFPKYNHDTVSTLKQSPWLSLGTGFVLFFMIPITVMILLVSVFGIPLAFILAAAYVIFLYLVRIPLILWAGIFFFKRFDKTVSDLWAFFVGLLIYFLLTIIPIAGTLMTFAVLLFGAGAVILTIRNLYVVEKA